MEKSRTSEIRQASWRGLAGSVGALRQRFSQRLGRGVAKRSPERELLYRKLFERVSDGFAVVEAIRDPGRRLVDYVVIEANPALLRILQADEPVVGRRASEVLQNAPPAWIEACELALEGEPLSFEYHAPGSRRWFEIHLSRLSEDQLAQFVADITDRKNAEARQAEMFDELNHRVKNNLAMVSAMLTMQARATDTPPVAEQLAKAVDRIHAIADAHASLYRTGRKDTVDFSRYLHDLCERLSNSILDRARLRLDLDLEPAFLPLDKAVALGVIVNELVTNAAKHAYPAPKSGAIAVKLARAGGVAVSVSDNGPGLPAEQARGLGMRLVRSLVQQIGGKLTIAGTQGATFTVRLTDDRAQIQDPAEQAPLI